MKENLTGTTWHWQRTLMNDDTSFAPDDPSRAIVAFAKRDGTDLIVMGGRSNPGSTRHGGQGR